jgi:tRNA-specific 2-thiouridylase
MSGGVDSSVAAALLVEAGHDVIGLTMQLHNRKDTAAPVEGSCCSIDDVSDARQVAEELGIPFFVVNYEREFQALVVDNLVEEYLQGRTPNPCARCNEFMKFRLLLKRAVGLGAQSLATGHYARIERAAGEPARLFRGEDASKDQTYFLHAIDQRALELLRFPLGGMTKDTVRLHAERFGLATSQKPESQDVCFVAGEHYSDFIGRHAPSDRVPGEGEIVDAEGNVLGSHEGHHRYTVGQRRGIGIAASRPLHVLATEPSLNRVVVGPRGALVARGLEAERVHWISGQPPGKDRVLSVCVRYHGKAVGAQVVMGEGGHAEVRFLEPVDAVTPGQVVVFYDGDEVLGGGTIARAVKSAPPMAREVA